MLHSAGIEASAPLPPPSSFPELLLPLKELPQGSKVPPSHYDYSPRQKLENLPSVSLPQKRTQKRTQKWTQKWTQKRIQKRIQKRKNWGPNWGPNWKIQNFSRDCCCFHSLLNRSWSSTHSKRSLTHLLKFYPRHPTLPSPFPFLFSLLCPPLSAPSPRSHFPPRKSLLNCSPPPTLSATVPFLPSLSFSALSSPFSFSLQMSPHSKSSDKTPPRYLFPLDQEGSNRGI